MLLLGIGWIVVLTWLCWRGIEISARIQITLVVVEVAILLVMAIVALIKVANGSAPPGHIDPTWSWFNPLKFGSFDSFMQGMLLMVFIYWGWDTTTSINEETDEPGRIPGSAGVYSTFLLLGTYILVVVAVQAFAGIGTHGIGLGDPAHINDVLSTLGASIFGSSTVGSILSHLLLFMVLTSAAATTQTTILPNARTTLSMAFQGAAGDLRQDPSALQDAVVLDDLVRGDLDRVLRGAELRLRCSGDRRRHRRDRVLRRTVPGDHRDRVLLALPRVRRRGFGRAVSYVWVPLAGGVALFVLLAYSFKVYWDPNQSYFTISVFGITIGGTLVVVVLATIAGLLWMLRSMRTQAVYFSGESMQLGLSITDDDQVVRVDISPEGFDEPSD